MLQPQHNWSFEHDVPSSVDQVLPLIAAILERLESQGWDDLDRFAIHLALEEALMNAVKHGNRFDASKRVLLRWHLQPEDAWFEITDEGAGFDRSAVPDPTDDEFLERASGRGVMLMELYMSEVVYNDLGNSVAMRKRRGERPQLDDE